MDIQTNQYDLIVDKLNFEKKFVDDLKALKISIPYYILKKVLVDEER